jgi:hypothetical protein
LADLADEVVGIPNVPDDGAERLAPGEIDFNTLPFDHRCEERVEVKEVSSATSMTASRLKDSYMKAGGNGRHRAWARMANDGRAQL